MSTRNTQSGWGWLSGIMVSVCPGAFWTWTSMSSVAIATVLVTATAAEAGQLSQWRYDEATQQLELTISDETTPRYFLLAQPARIVVDLPNTQVGDVPLEQTLSGAVRSVRINQFQPDLARVVIELSPDAVLASGQVEIQQTEEMQWAVRPLLAGDPGAESVAIAPQSTPSDTAEPTPVAESPALPVAPPPQSAPLDDAESMTVVEPPASDPTAVETLSGDSLAPDADADPLPPLEPGAIELSVTPPEEETTETDTAEAMEAPEASTLESELEVPSIRDAIADMGVGERQVLPPEEEEEGAIALDPASDSLSVEVSDVTITEAEHQFDPTAPVLDATEPTVPSQPVLDATQPSAVLSPQATLTQLNAPESQDSTATDIPIAPSPQSETSVQETADNVESDSEAIARVDPAEAESIRATEEETASEATTVTVPTSPNGFVPNSTIVFGQPMEESSEEREAISEASPEDVAPEDIAIDVAPEPETRSAATSGMTVSLRYPGDEPLALSPGVRQDVLLLQQPLVDGQGNVVAEAGSSVIGRFETNDTGSKFVIQAIATQTENIRITGESQPIAIQTNPEDIPEVESAVESPSEFNPASLFSGMATSTVARIQPSHVVIQPDQIITVQLTEDLAFR